MKRKTISCGLPFPFVNAVSTPSIYPLSAKSGLDEDGLPGRRLVPSVGGELHAAHAKREHKSQEGLHRSAKRDRECAFEPGDNIESVSGRKTLAKAKNGFDTDC